MVVEELGPGGVKTEVFVVVEVEVELVEGLEVELVGVVTEVVEEVSGVLLLDPGPGLLPPLVMPNHSRSTAS